MTPMISHAALEILRPSQHYPLVRVKGEPYERGRLYGLVTVDRVAHTLRAYAELFDAYARLPWHDVRQYAARYEPVIRDFDPSLIAEIRGIADGAQVDFLDILAINVRTEVMYGLGELRAAVECTAFAVVPPASADGHTLLGQNWDWHPAAFESCVILAIENDAAPSIVTVVEAGLLSKMGMNSAGLGVATNAMVTAADTGDVGIPYHVLLRAIQSCRSVAEADSLVRSVVRASSANYLVADRSGGAIDLEAAPGGSETVFVIRPNHGTIGHANCFVSPESTVEDQTPTRRPLSMTRQRSIDKSLQKASQPITKELMMDVLQDHEGHPNSLCRHPSEQFNPIDRSATVASVIMDLNQLEINVADGPPCTMPYRRFAVEEIWPAVGDALGQQS